MKVAVVGSGYVGLVSAACFAELGHDVICVDIDEQKISSLRHGEIPIYEELLPELIARHSGHRLTFTTSLEDAVNASTAIFIAVGTPSSETGEADLSYVEAVARDLASFAKSYKVIVEKSTVPVYTCEWIRQVLSNSVHNAEFDVVSNPEFLREGTAVTDFLNPDRIVVGADSQRAVEVMKAIYEPLTSGEYHRRADAIVQSTRAARLLVTGAKSAELIKHASNAFLAMKISFVNAVATICERVGADIQEVAAGIGSDSRIGDRFLQPGLGYGGSCFPKDLKAFRSVAKEFAYNFQLLDEVCNINEDQCARFVKKVRSAVWNLKGKRIGVLGLAFKGGTDDVRESPAIAVVKQLIEAGCTIQAYDPAAMKTAAAVLPANSVAMVSTAYDTARETDALLILTDWAEFRALDLRYLRAAMKHPVIVDGRNLFEPRVMQEAGFTYHCIGRPSVQELPRPKLAGVNHEQTNARFEFIAD